MFKKRVGMGEARAKGQKDFETPMSLALGFWLCCVPITFLILALFLGWKVAGVGALVLFGLLVVICFWICTTKAYEERGEHNA
jgi:fatty acid desaturase